MSKNHHRIKSHSARCASVRSRQEQNMVKFLGYSCYCHIENNTILLKTKFLLLYEIFNFFKVWSDGTKLELFGHRDTANVKRTKGEAFILSLGTRLNSKTQWQENYAAEMLQFIWNWKFCQGEMNYEF